VLQGAVTICKLLHRSNGTEFIAELAKQNFNEPHSGSHVQEMTSFVNTA
jgi:hypothetical protein